MKKIFFAFLIILLFTIPAYAQWNDCPSGETNCTGECGAFVDTNNDKYCDHSQPEPTSNLNQSTIDGKEELAVQNIEQTEDIDELISGQDLKTKTVLDIATLYKIDMNNFIAQLEMEIGDKQIKETDSFQLLHDNYGLAPSRVKEIAAGLVDGVNTASKISQPTQKTVSSNRFDGNDYYLIPIVLVLSLLYGISWFLVKNKKLPLITHRKIWNFGMLFSFAPLVVLSMLLILRLSFGISWQMPFNNLFWHVEFGIMFSTIALFHIGWHLSYYKVKLQTIKK